VTTTVVESVSGLRERLAEHQRRMESDPAYRAEHARRLADELRDEEAERQRKWSEAQAAARVARIARNREGWGMPPRVIPMLAAVEDTDAVQKARAFMAENNPRTLLVLSGGTGCGKTVAACVALDYATAYDPYEDPAVTGPRLRRLDSEGRQAPTPRFNSPGQFVKAIDLVRAGTFDAAFWESLEAASVLVVDDLGTEPLDEKGWALANLAAMLDGRYDSLRKTILTTNLPLAAFKARYCTADGGRLYDRLRESGAYVELSGKSLRQPVTVPQPWQDTDKDEETP
jgi:DNA replication protein DnaC